MQSQTFVFFGIVGSGKGTQVKLLMDYFKRTTSQECIYIGTGDIFRKIIESSENDFDTQSVKEILSSGRLMPDEKTNKLVLNATKSEISPEKLLFYDGYPRTIPQSEYFWKLMQFLGRENIKIVYIKVGKDEAMKRNMLRGRHDDTKEGIAKRFDEYVNKVIPSMNYFKDKEGYTLYTINGEQTVEEVHQEIITKLGLK